MLANEYDRKKNDAMREMKKRNEEQENQYSYLQLDIELVIITKQGCLD